MSTLEIRGPLDTIARNWAALLNVTAGGGEPGGERNPSRPPVPVDILSLREEVRAMLAGWCLLVIEERELPGRVDGNDVLAMCTYLHNHAHWLAEHEAAEALVEELTTWARRVNGAANPPDPRGVKVGDCPECSTAVHWATDAPYATCRACGYSGDLDTWMQVLGLDAWISDRQAALLLSLSIPGRVVNAALVRKWAERGKLTRHEREGRIVFDAYEVREVGLRVGGRTTTV